MLKDIYAGDFLIGFAARSDYWLDEPCWTISTQ